MGTSLGQLVCEKRAAGNVWSLLQNGPMLRLVYPLCDNLLSIERDQLQKSYDRCTVGMLRAETVAMLIGNGVLG